MRLKLASPPVEPLWTTPTKKIEQEQNRATYLSYLSLQIAETSVTNPVKETQGKSTQGTPVSHGLCFASRRN
jgi:hypothetical protein